MSDAAASAREATALRRRVEEAVGANFEVEQEIGRGGMAVVYRALDKRLRRKVALKVLPPELAYRADVRSRFVREAQVAAQLSHANIVPIFAVDEIEGIVYFAMGLVEGETLAQLLTHNPRPGVDTARRILREVADGLAYAHEHGVVHRDVKPGNILIERLGGRALVSDFGIARAAEGDLRLTVTGVAVGTPAYMSPEQAMGEKHVDGRADIYALGVVGWQLLAGELPFQAENTPGMLMKHISEPPRALGSMRGDLPANLVYAVERAMAKSREDRWPDALAFREALDERVPAPSEAFSNTHTMPAVVGVRDPGRSRDPAGAANFMGSPPREQSETAAQAIRELREQQQLWRDRQQPAAAEQDRLSSQERRVLRHEGREVRRPARERAKVERTPEEMVRGVQRNAVRYIVTLSFLAALNMITSPQFPWFLVAALGMGIALALQVGSLWVDDISLWRLFRHQPLNPASGPMVSGRSTRGRGREEIRRTAPDLRGVSPDLLDGPYGTTIREAAEARALIGDLILRLPDLERLNLPDVQTTAAALEERIRALAGALHQLDRDASPDAIRKLESKLAEAHSGSGDVTERERRVSLLERQHATLKELADRRRTVAQQLESAALLLQTLKLDLLKLHSSDIEAKIADSTLATQEARAVAMDLERVVDAANEVRKL